MATSYKTARTASSPFGLVLLDNRDGGGQQPWKGEGRDPGHGFGTAAQKTAEMVVTDALPRLATSGKLKLNR